MKVETDLVESSLRILREGQTASGAILACPSFPTYRYCWFRDGAFVAQALDRWGDHGSARRFYEWGARVVLQHAGIVETALSAPLGSVPDRYLHTRYTVDGAPGDDDWPNFQLDGFGTFLWGMVEHLRMSGVSGIPAAWQEAVDLLATYLGHLWRSPSFDCWEEYPDELHISTLCALYGGLAAVGEHVEHAGWKQTAEEVRAFILDHRVEGGRLPKFVGSNAVDASLLWACVPFRVLEATDPSFERTAARIEADLLGPYGGIHRYQTDSYYGGGEWVLLTGLLGEYRLLRGDREGATTILRWMEQQASPSGELPEQVPRDLNCPERYQPWVQRWGAVACPLLWSHAEYLRLKYALQHG